MNVKTKILMMLASLSGAVFVLALLAGVTLIVNDISVGALQGEPETGWGFLITFFFFGPIAIAASVSFFFLSKRYKNETQRSLLSLYVGSLVLALLIFAGFWANDKLANPPENPRDAKMTKDLTDTERKIDSLFYKNKGTLPSEVEISQSLIQGATYKIISENTFQLCGSFEKSTIDEEYKKRPESAGSITTKKVVEGETLKSSEAMGVFGLHNAGIQCYTIELIKPTRS